MRWIQFNNHIFLLPFFIPFFFLGGRPFCVPYVPGPLGMTKTDNLSLF